MDLIVSHTNADFDALGSLIAAKKLYPHARMLMPGSAEKAVREFVSIFKDAIKVENEGECSMDNVDRLIVVDTRHKSRIGVASRLIDEKGIAPVIYDHHPRTKYDMRASKDVYEEVGATITILLDAIKKRSIKITPMEATIMLLGIYEETGSLTFRTTTKKDVDAVSYLFSRGARLNMVSSYLNRELNEEELAFLVRLIGSTRMHNINGVKVAISVGDTSKYIGELGMILHKLIDVENIKVIFLLLKTDSKTNIIARSHIPDVDVNKILRHFGGAGHASAASGKVTGFDTNALKEELIRVLKKSIKIRVLAEDIMSKPVTVSVDMKIKDAKKLFAANRLKGAVVAGKNKRYLGVINGRNINKAIRRGYGHARVKGYMLTKVGTAILKTPLYKIQEILASGGIGIIPVLKRKKCAGIITRNDILKVLHQGLIVDRRLAKRKKRILNLAKKIKSALPKKITGLLKFIGKLAQDRHAAAFVVGGFVRDLIMGVKNYDIDIVVEGDAVEFSRAFADAVKGPLVVHRKFGTATVVMPWGLAGDGHFKVDIATARRERYKRPAALPDVEFSSLRDDLYRRDFTINAMAIALNMKNFGQLIDFFDGQEHLREGIVSVLHEGSFIDDPTRIFRAVRFEQRFGFKIDGPTEELIKTAIKNDMFGRTGNMRIRDELILMLMEEDPLAAIMRMHELDELRFIHPKLKINKGLNRLFSAIGDLCAWYEKNPHLRKRRLDKWLIYLMALLDGLDIKTVSFLCDKFVLRRGDRARILSCKKENRRILESFSRKKNLLPSVIYKKLHPLSYEAILLMMAKADKKRVKDAMADFMLKYNSVKIRTTGDDLERVGFKPGPEFGRTLKKILYAKLDGRIKTDKDELPYIIKGDASPCKPYDV